MHLLGPFLLAATALAAPNPQSLLTKPNLPACPTANYPAQHDYTDATTKACKALFKTYAGIPNAKMGDRWKLHQAQFFTVVNVPTFGGGNRNYSFFVEQKNGKWPGLDLSFPQCEQGFFAEIDIPTEKNALCTVKGAGGMWYKLVMGWSSRVWDVGYATADFWVASS